MKKLIYIVYFLILTLAISSCDFSENIYPSVNNTYSNGLSTNWWDNVWTSHLNGIDITSGNFTGPVGPAGPTGANGTAGLNGTNGTAGASGPNTVSTLTSSNFTNGTIFKSNGSMVVAATPGTDYLTTDDDSAYVPKTTTVNGQALSTNVTVTLTDVAQYTMTVGEAITHYQVCYVKSDGDVYKAKADATITMPALLIASDSAVAGSLLLYTNGFITNGAWGWTPGSLLYVDNTTAGAITATPPGASGNVVQIVGQALSATTIYFNPSLVTAVLK
jgi:hypothetical protein